MVSLNQFKLLNQKCESYFKLLENELGYEIEYKKESNIQRFGFYLYMLESITSIKDISDLLEMITDTDFNDIIFHDSNDDFGIDAVSIDYNENYIYLFNFKFRENFNSKKAQKLNDVFISQKFTNAIQNLNSKGLKGKLKKFADEIIENLKTKEIWKMKLYMVSNDSKNLNEDDLHIENLKQFYDLEIQSISLIDISNFMSIRPDPINALLVLPRDSVLSYAENSLSSAKSYVFRLGLNELIRITCKSEPHRRNYNLEDYNELNKFELEYATLFDNVRGFLGNTKFNEKILDTLNEESEKFFMYNNGLTITARDIIAEEINGRTKLKLELKNMQIVNGGQTLRTIHNFKSKDINNINDYLTAGEILVRVFKTGDLIELTRKIAEFTNSQNAISPIDLKSIASEQIEIEQYLDGYNIIYARKVGDTGLSLTKKYKFKISLEKFAQILFSIQGNPHKATNQKKKIFEKYYKDIFGANNFDISESPSIIERYFEIKNIYDSLTKYNSNDQKIFYIFYLDYMVDMDVKDKINFLESVITKFRSDEDISPARKLIQNGFKELLDKKIDEL